MTWEEIKLKYPIGTEIQGIVIRKAPFGDFIEIEHEQDLTVLLRIIEMKDLTPEIYKTGDYNPLGSSIKAIVSGFYDRNHQIGVTQMPFDIELAKTFSD
jgi:ribosomal protein S1